MKAILVDLGLSSVRSWLLFLLSWLILCWNIAFLFVILASPLLEHSFSFWAYHLLDCSFPSSSRLKTSSFFRCAITDLFPRSLPYILLSYSPHILDITCVITYSPSSLLNWHWTDVTLAVIEMIFNCFLRISFENKLKIAFFLLSDIVVHL